MQRDYSVNEAADELGVSPNTVRRWIREGLLRFYRVSEWDRPMIHADEVENLKAIMRAYDQNTHGLTAVLSLLNREPSLKDEVFAKANERLEEVA